MQTTAQFNVCRGTSGFLADLNVQDGRHSHGKHMMAGRTDAVVVGSGPNGLAAAIRLAQDGLAITVLEANSSPGGAVRSAALTRDGFSHDPFAAVFPIARASPFFASLNLSDHGLDWIDPPVPLAHPLDDGSAVLLHRAIDPTAAGLGSDEKAYQELMHPIAQAKHTLVADLLRPPGTQENLADLARFGLHALRSTTGFAASNFHEDRTRALFAGSAAHSFLPLEEPISAGYGLFLTLLGHAVGWPIVRGGASKLTSALVSVAERLGVNIELECPVRTLDDVPSARAVLFDVAPHRLQSIAGRALPAWFRRDLRRHRYGPGVFKVDYALDAPVPWSARACADAGTLHLGGNMEEIATSEREVSLGLHPRRPFVIASQPSLFDDSRAPSGCHTLWAYAHVPHASTFDMADRIERQIERFAPGFQRHILARHVMRPADLESTNANLVGGSINGGYQDLRTYFHWFLTRPSPYATPNPMLFRCSAATPPGGGVHGMAGFHAAEYVLKKRFARH